MADGDDAGGDALDERGRAPRSEHVRGSLSTLQLPRRLAAAAAAVEPARFDALVDAIAQQWAASSPDDNGRTETTLKWTSLVNMYASVAPPRGSLCAGLAAVARVRLACAACVCVAQKGGRGSACVSGARARQRKGTRN
jgi:hypothetical protein